MLHVSCCTFVLLLIQMEIHVKKTPELGKIWESGNRKRCRQTGSRQSTPLSTIRTRYGNSVSTPEATRTGKTQQNSLQKGSRYGISVSTPHRRYGHRLRTPFLRTPFPRQNLGRQSLGNTWSAAGREIPLLNWEEGRRQGGESGGRGREEERAQGSRTSRRCQQTGCIVKRDAPKTHLCSCLGGFRWRLEHVGPVPTTRFPDSVG